MLKLSSVLLIVGLLGATGPEFEVATIKLAQPFTAQAMAGKIRVGIKVDAGRIDAGSMSLEDLIRYAYRLKQFQVSGPASISGDRFDVVATLPQGASTEQAPEMMQALLAERFHLVVHRENKEQSVYALVIGKNGPKLKESPADSNPAPGGQMRITQDGRGAVVTGGLGGTVRMAPGRDGNMRMEASKMTLPAFAEMLSRFVDKPVVDMTELKGAYQFSLELSMADMMKGARTAGVVMPPGAMPGGRGVAPPDAASDPSGGSVFQSVQELGLRLEPRKSAIAMVVVDHVDKSPTDN
jgi:uncharacterized protein (TIGR03435 family)